MTDLSLYIADGLTIISIILALLYSIGFTRQSKAYTFFTLYLLLVAVIQIVMYIYAYKKLNSIFFFHYYFVGQFILLSLFYRQLLKSRLIVWILIVVLIGLGGYYAVNPAIFNQYHTIGVSITQSIIVVYALLYYYKSLSGHNLFLLVNTGILLYFLTSILLFASGNLILDLNLPKETQRYIGIINQFLYFIFLVLVFVEWFRNYRSSK
ncbi:hypothetical protein G5B37_04485 [Rasiella rasia]|uniref:Uncharacterized protein n=1 Tax=Rasiella rasia TaxID=2744027 RepID=A0A6G6GKA5_9FLAO|nr:hypothetical protein [Rasiella rasia]QIE58843.1 hypothetical protein G5B37_04485 [Rasiella rasia]